MKNSFNYLAITTLLLFSAICHAGGFDPDAFVITVKSDNTGTSTNKQFTIPTFGSGYNYNVDCNSDGSFEATDVTGDYTCDFSVLGGVGTYQVSIIGAQANNDGFPRIYFNNTGDRLKITNIDQWGANVWDSMQGAFWGASNMTVTATDVPNLSQVNSTRLMFSAAYMANPDTSMWDTSNITNMAVMFQNATSATPDVSNWNVSMVSNMGFLFAGATNANPNLSQWDFNNATDMTTMLGGSGISTINYDAFLVNIDKNTNLVNINLNNVQASHCSIQAQAAFTNLTTIDGWTINDNGLCAVTDTANDFVLVVDTNIVGSTSNTQFEINTNNSNGEIYKYNVDCDGDTPGINIATNQTGNYICTYTNPGTYAVHISDNIGDKKGFPRYYAFFFDDAKKIVDLKQWGTGIWSSMNYAFYNTPNMIVSAVDIPDLSQTTDLFSMFRFATLANPNTRNWNVSNVTKMGFMFNGATSASPDTSIWNTSKVSSMSGMFSGATSANPDTSTWDTAMVQGMSSMFKGATSANPDTSTWNMINVANMSFMFNEAISANPNTNGWDTAKVTDMSSMFKGATSANPDTNSWNTSMVADMSSMFSGATSANPDTSSWNTNKVTNMSNMFIGATSANPNVQSWDITKINGSAFSNMTDIFLGVTLPTADYDAMLAHFNSQAVQSGVTFSGGNSKYCNVSAHDNLTNATTGHGWTITDGGLDPNCPDPLDDFVIEVDTTKIGSTSSTQFEINTFGGGYNYNVECDSANAFINTATAQTGNYICNYATPGVYTIRISDNIGDKTGFPRLYSFLHNDTKKIVDLKQWGTSVWASMSSIFLGASNMVVTATDVPNLSQVNSMSYMFANATFANPNTNNWNTANVSNMRFMFTAATSANPDTSGWNTVMVTDMRAMFNGATSANPNTSGWNTAVVTDMRSMFSGATSANPDVSGWNTANVGNMSDMFQGATSANPDTSNWDTSLVSEMSGMFSGAINARPDVSSWDITNVDEMDGMFDGVTLPTPVYDAILNHFNTQAVFTGTIFSGGNSKYCASVAYNYLQNTQQWTITDGGLDANCPSSLEDFVIKVDTNLNGFTSNLQFKVKTLGMDYNFNVDCNDANPGANTAIAQTADYICNYSSPGIYTIRISDNKGDLTGFPHFYNEDPSDSVKIIELIQWGSGKWTSMESAFNNASHMIVNATDAPDLSNVLSLKKMFKGAGLANPDTSSWNTANINDMSFMFNNASLATPNTASWITTNVLDMSYMFRGATQANPDTSNWDTAKVTTMSNMFFDASNANPVTIGWDTTEVTSMNTMFYGASSANPNTNGWNTAKVTDMALLFADAISANPNTSNWDTGKVSTMFSMFNGATNANPDTSGWDTSKVERMDAMFASATSANPNVQSWDVTKVFSMQLMFDGVTLPTADYDALLRHFNSQLVISNIPFSGGNSTYCAVAAHDNLTNTTTGHGWNITDGGVCDDIIFRNGFEIVVVKFNAQEKQVNYDFSKLEGIKLDNYAELIAIGVDEKETAIIKIYIHKVNGQRQIGFSNHYLDDEQEQWTKPNWQDFDNKDNTTISW